MDTPEPRPTPIQPAPPPILPKQPTADTRFDPVPMQEPIRSTAVIDALLKQPGKLFHAAGTSHAGKVAAILIMVLLVSLGVYGLVAGSLTGGMQLWAAPLKIVCGSIAAALICLPSLYIFLCLGGSDIPLRNLSVGLLCQVALSGLLLLGLAPVAWVFSQSTDSVAMMGVLHLVFWGIATSFGLRLLTRGARSGGSKDLGAWGLIYILVSLQMMTALRPIIGSADTLLPTEKRFFLSHWGKVLAEQK